MRCQAVDKASGPLKRRQGQNLTHGNVLAGLTQEVYRKLRRLQTIPISWATANSMNTQISAAVPPPKSGTSIATGFSRQRLVSTTPSYSQTYTVTGKNKILRLADSELIRLNCTCLVALVARYPCHWASRTLASQPGFAPTASPPLLLGLLLA